MTFAQYAVIDTNVSDGNFGRKKLKSYFTAITITSD